MKKPRSQPKPPLNLRIKLPLILAWTFATFAFAAMAFVGGYILAWVKVSGVYAETAVLKAKAVELEGELQRLRNYAALIDAMTIQGQAANELQKLPQTVLATDTAQGGKVERN